MTNEYFALMGPIGWLIPMGFMLLLGLGIAALVKYLFMPRRHKKNASNAST